MATDPSMEDSISAVESMSCRQPAMQGESHRMPSSTSQGLTPPVVAALADCASDKATAQAGQNHQAPEGQPRFGGWLRARRTQARVSRQQLADESGLTWSALTSVEAGKLWRHSEVRDCLIAALSRLMSRERGRNARG